MAQLRRDVDRLRSKELASSGSANLRLQDLAELQLQVGEQLRAVRLLVRTATDLGADVYPASLSPPIQRDIALPSKASPLDEVERGLRDIEQETSVALTALTEVVAQSADAISGELSRIGHALSSDDLPAVGGVLLQNADGAIEPAFDAGPTMQRSIGCGWFELRWTRFPFTGPFQPPVSVRTMVFGGIHLLGKEPFTPA